MVLLFFEVRNVVIFNTKFYGPGKWSQLFDNSCQAILLVCRHFPHKIHENNATDRIAQGAGFFTCVRGNVLE